MLRSRPNSRLACASAVDGLLYTAHDEMEQVYPIIFQFFYSLRMAALSFMQPAQVLGCNPNSMKLLLS